MTIPNLVKRNRTISSGYTLIQTIYFISSLLCYHDSNLDDMINCNAIFLCLAQGYNGNRRRGLNTTALWFITFYDLLAKMVVLIFFFCFHLDFQSCLQRFSYKIVLTPRGKPNESRYLIIMNKGETFSYLSTCS